MPFVQDPIHVRVVGGSVDFYKKVTATNLYVEQVFGGIVNSVTITNDSATDTIQVSFNGAALEAELSPGEALTLHTKGKNYIYIKGTAGGDPVRLWGW